MKNSDFRLLEMEPDLQSGRTPHPLKFGSGVVRETTSFTVRCRVENRSGAQCQGWGNILLSDLWAYPTPLMTHEERDAALREVSLRLCSLFSEFKEFAHPIRFYYEVKKGFPALARAVETDLQLKERLPDLAVLMCASPLDAALHDAFGCVNNISSYDGYGPEMMDEDLSAFLGAEFKGKYIADYLKKDFTDRLPIFHLVGGVDKLTDGEITDSDPKDGLPVSLEQWIAKEGIFCFKVKLRATTLIGMSNEPPRWQTS